MNHLNQSQYLYRVATDTAMTEANAVLAAAALLTFVHHDTGRCDPSIEAIGKRMRRGEEAVRKGLQALEAAGHIEIEHRFNRSNCYTLKLMEMARAPEKPRTQDPEKPTPPPSENRVLTGSESSLKTEQNRAQKAAEIRRLLRAVPDDVQPTLKALQQIPTKPGCSYEKLIPKVLGAVDRCGARAVEDLYRLVAGEKGRMPPWELYRMLDGLTPHSDQHHTAPSDRAPDPVESSAFDEARRIVEDAHPTIPAQIAVQNRIRQGHGRVEAGWWADRRHWIAQELARVIAGERGTHGKL